MPTKRQILELLPQQTLRDLIDKFGLDARDRRSKQSLVEALAKSRTAALEEILGSLRRDELKIICRGLELGDSGKEKAGIIERILGREGQEPPWKLEPQSVPAHPPGVTDPVASPADDVVRAVKNPVNESSNKLSPLGQRGVIAPGAHIELRDAVWRVVRVDTTSSGKAAWRCIGVSEIVRDQEALFLEELEPEVRVLDPRTTAFERDISPHHRAGLLHIESLLRDVPPPEDGLYIGHRAVMDKLDFQLEPAWQALRKPRQRILIADAVGLGKTIEAGILLSELIRRGRGRRILVATVKSMLTQFQKELWGRFSIPLVRLDSVGLQRIRSDIPTHHNPFYTFDRTIISIDTLKQNNWFRTHVEQAYWDVILIDEAHNVAKRGGGKSMRARIAEVLARNCDSLILLSATPHDGKPRSFASLMNMLDPTAITDPDDYSKEDIHGLFVRRFKKDVADQLGKRIPQRHIATSRSVATAAEERAFGTLARLSFTHIDQHPTGGLLFKTTLEKSLFSSPAACLQTIQNRIRSQERREDAKAFVKDVSALRILHDEVQAIHDDPASFSKYGKLLEVVREHWKWLPTKAKEDRIVIFTERRETLDFLAKHLSVDLDLGPSEWRVLHGSLSDTAQQEIVEAFGKTQDPIRLLLATDVAAEGLNLHYLCHRMIHFDVPWSLMVFQQRNGRIDRYGQEHEPRIVYLLTESQQAAIKGDTRILELLIEKDEQAQKNIGDPSAFMNVYDIEEEELITGRAMEANRTAAEFEAELQSRLVDPFAVILGEAAAASASQPDGSAREPAPVRDLPSLFASDFDYLEAALRRLQETTDLVAKVRPKERLVELQAPPDLLRRFDRLPLEIRPEDGVMLLTADPDRMARALADARREENAWPRHQYLWPIGPVMDWLTGRLRGELGRHTAPVLCVTEPFQPGETAIILSGLLPNRRAQPLVHLWYVARFLGTHTEGPCLDRLEPFPEFLRETGFGARDLPNPGTDLPIEALRRILPVAVEALQGRLAVDRQAFIDCTAPRLRGEKERLERLKGRQLDFAALIFGSRTDVIAEQERDKRRRQVERLFGEHQRWVEDAMTIGEVPFIQVIAALHRQPGSTTIRAEGSKGARR